MKRIYHDYRCWEEFTAGMWRPVPKTEVTDLLQRAIEFTGNAVLYGSFMQRVAVEWPISCEQNLTERALNRKAWIGHAACCLAINCPEQITRQAWRHLTDQQRNEANAEAARTVKAWEAGHAKKN